MGEAYQQLINGLIDMRGFRSGSFVASLPVNQRSLPQNILLYVVFGNPALAPFEPLAQPQREKN